MQTLGYSDWRLVDVATGFQVDDGESAQTRCAFWSYTTADRCDHVTCNPSSHTTSVSQGNPPDVPKRLEIFSPNFTCLLNLLKVPMTLDYQFLLVYMQL